MIGRNKKCITLNLRDPRGQALARRLTDGADFLLENFRPGTLERWSLGYEELAATNPGLIMIRVSGFGQTGPYAARAGYGVIGEAMGGMRHLAGDPSAPPSRVGLSIGDSLAATFGCLGGLMALEHRHRTGRGQVVDAAIYEAVLAMLESTVPEYTEAGFVRERTGSILPKVSPSNVYPTRDASILIAANQDSVWRRLAQAMERADLADDARFATHHARGEHQAELDGIISAWSQAWDSTALLGLLERSGVPAGKIYTAADMLGDPQFVARQALVHVPHKEFANLVQQNCFPRLSETPGEVRWPGPELGEHNEEIYGGLLGLGALERSDLRAAGII